MALVRLRRVRVNVWRRTYSEGASRVWGYEATAGPAGRRHSFLAAAEMTTRTDAEQRGFVHSALFYHSQKEYLDFVLRFVIDGLAMDKPAGRGTRRQTGVAA